MGISAKIIADSVSLQGKRITTFEIEYPRIILAELNTHRMLSKNSSSSRAQPVSAVAEQVGASPFVPWEWGKNKSGMQAEEELSVFDQTIAEDMWNTASNAAVFMSKTLMELKVHKQLANRLTEPFQWMKSVVTATEWDNFFWLRDHPDAQPEFRHLAWLMKQRMEQSTPIELFPGDWHVPYYFEGRWVDNTGGIDKWTNTLEDALKISVSCCCQVSYRKLDDSPEKAEKIFNMLGIGTENPVHASPMEHQASPMNICQLNNLSVDRALCTEEGITAYHKELGWMSGNFSEWVQYRQTVEGSTKWH